MEDCELIVDLRLAEQRLRLALRGRWYIEMQLGRRAFDSKRPQQCQVIINRVQAAHPFGEIGENAGACFRLPMRAMGRDPFLRAGQIRQNGRAVVAREIDAKLEPMHGDGKEDRDVSPVPAHNQEPIHIRNCRSKFAAFASDRQRNPCLRKFFPNRVNSWRGQNQIANPF